MRLADCCRVSRNVQEILLHLIESTNMRPLYRRNILLARLSAAFALVPEDGPDIVDGKPSSFRLNELLRYVDDQKYNASCFDDVKGFIERLDSLAIKYVTHDHPLCATETNTEGVKKTRAKVLLLKLRYFALSCPGMTTSTVGESITLTCTFCNSVADATSCTRCLNSLVHDGCQMYHSLTSSNDDSAKDEILSDLALVIAFCLVRLAFPNGRNIHVTSQPSTNKTLLRALMLLEHQLSLSPKHSQISLVLVQLHLFLGSAPRARDIWETLGVKRTIMDSLAPLFYDRISTISPAVISPSDNWGWELMEMLKSHYSVSLKMRMPKRLIDAFENGSYSSILEIPRYIERLRASCTRAMSLVESTRSERFLEQSYGEVLHDTRFSKYIFVPVLQD